MTPDGWRAGWAGNPADRVDTLGIVTEDSDALAAVAAVRGGDVLLDIPNPGRWMAHCHIAEHHESGMMLSFDVLPLTRFEAARRADLPARPGRDTRGGRDAAVPLAERRLVPLGRRR